MTPLSARRAKSATSTPAQEQQPAKGGGRLRQKLFFAPLTEALSQTKDLESPLIASPLKLYGIGDRKGGKCDGEGGTSDGEGGKSDGEGDKGDGDGNKGDGEGDKGDGDGGMGDALGEELGDLWETNCDLQRQLEVILHC